MKEDLLKEFNNKRETLDVFSGIPNKKWTKFSEA